MSRPGCTVALIGIDGSGKSTVADLLLARATRPARILYMGLNASRVNTPVSLGHLADKVVRRDESEFRGEVRDRGGRVRAVARLVYRIVEETLRFAQAGFHRRRGDLVIMDRHFRFDHVLGVAPTQISERIHVSFLRRTPLPDVVFYLDVPITVGMERSGEGSMRYHEKRRTAYEEYERTLARVIRIDGDRPPVAVVSDIEGHLRAVTSASGR